MAAGMNRKFALIPAAGVGARMQSGIPKQYLPIAGRPMLQHVINTFIQTPAIAHVFVVVSADDAHIDSLRLPPSRVTVLRHGGATRQESVRNALAAMQNDCDDQDWVLVHDAARPGLTPELVMKLIAALEADAVGGLLALPVVDTIKRAGADQRVQATPSREGLWAAQTPQMFRCALLRQALAGPAQVTDEASAIEAMGLQPLLVEGSARNFKVTLPEDVKLAELLLGNLK